MPKIKTVKFTIADVDHHVHINCTTTGLFTCNVPSIVSQSLHLDSKITEKTLEEVEVKLHAAINKYKTSETNHSLCIMIRYESSGIYSQKSDGLPLFGGYRHKYQLEGQFGSASNALGFSFKVAIIENIDGNVRYFKARRKKRRRLRG